MNIDELEYLRVKSAQIFDDLPGKKSFRSELSYPESPNPSCLFETDGIFSVQGRFWLNKEYLIEAISNESDIGLIECSGVVDSLPEALQIILEFKNKIASTAP